MSMAAGARAAARVALPQLRSPTLFFSRAQLPAHSSSFSSLTPSSSRGFASDHHGPARVNILEDPLSPSKQKEEHIDSEIQALNIAQAEMQQALNIAQAEMQQEITRMRMKFEAKFSNVEAKMEEDALVWAPNYICIVAGELLQFLLRRQPQPFSSPGVISGTHPFVHMLAKDLQMPKWEIRHLCRTFVQTSAYFQEQPGSLQESDRIVGQDRKMPDVVCKVPEIKVHFA